MGRKKKGRKPKKITLYHAILIICEDTKSSVFYFKGWAADHLKELKANHVRINVEPSKRGQDPERIIRYAKEHKDSYDEIYCVLDVDDHAHLTKALKEAKKNKFIPIVSNPCFELWYLLHFPNYSTRPQTPKLLEKELGKLLGTKYDKGFSKIYELLNTEGSEEEAIKKAEKLKTYAQKHTNNQDITANPSTEVFQLIEHLRELIGKS